MPLNPEAATGKWRQTPNMQEPTIEQIKEEISKLRTMKPSVLSRSAFGDDHHAAIEAQIHVLDTMMDEDSVEEEYGDSEDNIRSAALDAAEWLLGDSDESPSDGWKSLVRRP